jgi:hypothetical protein
MSYTMTIEDIRALAEVERKMDSGEIAFVRFGGDRVSLPIFRAIAGERAKRLNALLSRMKSVGMHEHLPTLEEVQAAWRGE